MAVDFVTQFMNVVAPPTTFMTLFLLLPPLYFYRAFINFMSSLHPEDVTGKVAVITGASSGIGEQLVYEYARRGACLALVARREDRLKEIADRARELGSADVIVVPADVSKADDCRRFIDEAVNHFGRLDHLVNNAGISSMCLFEEASNITNFAPVMDINFWGLIYPTYYAISHLKKNKGKVVVTSSAAGYVPMPRMSFYNASKAALTNFYETLRMEFGSEIGITIATPGWIESEMTQGKFLSKEGNLQTDQETRDVQVGLFPVGYATGCAKGIVDAACRGKRYVTEPFWFRVMYLYRFFAPEVLDWVYHQLYMPRPQGASKREALSKKLLDATGAKKFLYPSSIQTAPDQPAAETSETPEPIEPTKMD